MNYFIIEDGNLKQNLHKKELVAELSKHNMMPVSFQEGLYYVSHSNVDDTTILMGIDLNDDCILVLQEYRKNESKYRNLECSGYKMFKISDLL